MVKMRLKQIRRNLPSFVGGPVEQKSFKDNTSYIGNKESAQKKNDERAEVIRTQLEDLPESSDIEAELSFPGVEGLEQNSEQYSGKDEVVAAYETWMADHDLEEELLSYDLVMFSSKGEFQIRLEEINEIHTHGWSGPYCAGNSYQRSDFGELGAYETLTRIETGETVAVLEGEYERSV